MSISRLNKDMSIISALPDSPTLSASELKAKFDEGGKAVQEHINNTLIPEIEWLLEKKQGSIIVCKNEPSGGEDGDIILVYKG